jgi:hypothetical protein
LPVISVFLARLLDGTAAIAELILRTNGAAFADAKPSEFDQFDCPWYSEHRLSILLRAAAPKQIVLMMFGSRSSQDSEWKTIEQRAIRLRNS